MIEVVDKSGGCEVLSGAVAACHASDSDIELLECMDVCVWVVEHQEKEISTYHSGVNREDIIRYRNVSWGCDYTLWGSVAAKAVAAELAPGACKDCG